MKLSNHDQPLLLPKVLPEMLHPAFWTSRFRDLGLAEDWIENFQFPTDPGLTDYLRGLDHCLGAIRDEEGAPVQKEEVLAQIKVWEQPEYGLMVEAGDLKLLPREEPLFSNQGEPDLDRNQLSGLDPGDPLILLGESLDGNWLIAISDGGAGWVKRGQIGIGSRKEIADYYHDPDRLVAVEPGPELLTNDGLSGASMGCSFPLNDHLRQTLLIPGRNSNGKLILRTGLIIGETVRGHLPQTAHHILRQAFKYLGWNYAWGDRDGKVPGRDCSRLVRDVLRSLGFRPPRNSGAQLAGGKNRLKLTGMNIPERLAGLKEVSPGSLLFTPSHVLFLLGEYRGEIYAIHALNNYRRIADNKEEAVKVKQVVVSGLSLGLGTGTGSLLEQLTEVVEV